MTSDPNWTLLAPTVVGGLLALVGSFGAIYLPSLVNRRNRRRNLAGALAGEIGSLIDLIERRDYVGHLRELIQHVESTGKPAAFYFTARHNYFGIYQANLGSLGMLPPDLAAGVARFYANSYAFLEDVDAFREGWMNPIIQAQALERLREMERLLVDTLDLAKRCRTRAYAVAGPLKYRGSDLSLISPV